ncbi:hypothetical protein RN001_003840 [Aquatica leii]|uniref:N(4)-(beta-N-acetylglucosaminyl)-L-asparaginase n=1 Tax=Aquatica leii TaxID=1421715 RepID=A0AAN7Q6P4_9COLE|nr:hypothetical protein RN001_003840 [Aquatica leii]
MQINNYQILNYSFFVLCLIVSVNSKTIPIVINTWAYPEATKAAWESLMRGGNRIDAIHIGCGKCEEIQCGDAVGPGGCPDENGETTLDSLIFDGASMDMGAVAGLRRIKNAVGVARRVLDRTSHSLIVGDQATKFAKQMGFYEESLTTARSANEWKEWKNHNCQPNFWKNVAPDPLKSCGPYKPVPSKLDSSSNTRIGHDTIGMLVIDNEGDIAAGTSTNGLTHKIPGRVGDSPIPGAGAYAVNDVGAACSTGDGDKMMRFLPSFHAIEELRKGTTPKKAAEMAVARIRKIYPKFFGAVLVCDKNGDYGAACNGMEMPRKRVLKTNRVLIDEANMKQAIIKVFNGTYSERRAAIIYEIRRTTLQSKIKRILSKYTKESYLTHNGERADDSGNDSIDEDSPKYSRVDSSNPIVLTTWAFPEATSVAWNELLKGGNRIDALEAGCSKCEELQCDGTVGYGGSPDENGETTLDALFFDGVNMNMGAVGGLRRVKNAMSVARRVLENTEHSFLIGDLATRFAKQMGFKEEALSTNNSISMWREWKNNNCNPNFWKNVKPDPLRSCGPYQPISENSVYFNRKLFDSHNHDTIGMIVVDGYNKIAAGTSTNGANHKIPGRVGDSPIPGAGAYADNDVGAAVATGNGDVMMRFLPSFLAVEEMRRGSTPLEASRIAVKRISDKYPNFAGAVLAVNRNGEYAAACNGMNEFPYSVIRQGWDQVIVNLVKCKI